MSKDAIGPTVREQEAENSNENNRKYSIYLNSQPETLAVTGLTFQ